MRVVCVQMHVNDNLSCIISACGTRSSNIRGGNALAVSELGGDTLRLSVCTVRRTTQMGTGITETLCRCMTRRCTDTAHTTRSSIAVE